MKWPYSLPDKDAAKEYRDNQIVTAEIRATRRARSYQQNKWIHAIFALVAENSNDPEWDTPEKTKRNVKMAMKFFKDDVVVAGNRVYFELRSFAFDQMDQLEANARYEEAKNICAKFMGLQPETLEAEAKNVA